MVCGMEPRGDGLGRSGCDAFAFAAGSATSDSAASTCRRSRPASKAKPRARRGYLQETAEQVIALLRRWRSRVRKATAAAFALLLFVVHIPPAPAAEQIEETAEVQNSERQEFSAQEFVKIEAAFYGLSRDPVSSSLLREAVELFDRQVPTSEIIERIERRRTEFRDSEARSKTLRDWGPEVAGVLATAGVAAGAAAALPGLAGAAVAAGAGAAAVGLISVTVPAAVDHWLNSFSRPEVAGSSSRTESAASMVDFPVYRSVVRAFENAEQFGPIWNATVEPVVGFRLDANPRDVLAVSPGLMQALVTRGMYTSIVESLDVLAASPPNTAELLARHRNALEESIRRELTTVREAVAANHQAVDEYRSQAEDFYNDQRERWLLEEQRAEEARRRQVHRANMENGRSVVRMAATVIGFSDADTGRQLGALGEAAFDVADALDAYDAAISIGANANLASLALTGNFVAIGLNFTNAILGVETIEQVILEEVRQLREEMHERFDRVHDHLKAVRGEMHERFDRLDGRLDGLNTRFDEVDLRFAEVRRQIGRVQELISDGFSALEDRMDDQTEMLSQLSRDLREVGQELEDIGIRQIDLYSTLTEDHEELNELIVSLELRPCLLEDRNPSSKNDFVGACLSSFAVIGERLVNHQRSATDDKNMLESALDERRDLTTNMSLYEFRRRLSSAERRRLSSAERTDSLTLPSSVVGPAGWFKIAEAYSRFVDLHTDTDPSVSEDYRKTMSDIKVAMRAQRSELIRYLDAITEDLSKFQDNSYETAFSMVFKDAWTIHEALEDLLESTVRSYYASDVAGVETLRHENDVLISELDLRGPYSWVPMEDFYAENELPEWVTVYRYSGCSTRALNERADVLSARRRGSLGRDVLEWSPTSRDWLVGGGILHFVNPSDLIPARMGLGRIEVCATGAHLPSVGAGTNRARLAVQAWFRGNSAEVSRACDAILSYETADGRLPAGNMFDLSTMLLDVSGRIRRQGSVLIDTNAKGEEVSDCQQVYLRHFKEEQQTFSDHVRDGLLESREFNDLARDLRIADAHVRAWIALAFDSWIERSATVEAVASGGAGFPDLQAMLESEPNEVWRLAERAAVSIRAFEEVLRSGPMRGIVAAGYAHRRLTESRFEALDD